MILIVGASGRLGSIVAQRLLEEGKQVRAMTRNPLNLALLKQRGAEVVSGDLRNPESFWESGCQVVSNCLQASNIQAAA